MLCPFPKVTLEYWRIMPGMYFLPVPHFADIDGIGEQLIERSP
jgi:hypothetical protein